MLGHPAFERSSYRDAVLASGPVQYWRLNENGGTTRAIDQKGVAHGTYTGSPVRGKAGPPGIPDAASFAVANGAGTYMDGGSGTLPQSAYTLAVWFRPTASFTDRGIFGRWSSPAGGAFFWVDTSSLKVSNVHTGTIGNWIRDGATLVSGRWYFLTQTWDGATLRGYVNGVQTGTPKSVATAPGSPANNWWVGMYSSTANIATGDLAEAAYWDRALPAGEVAHLSAIGYGA